MISTSNFASSYSNQNVSLNTRSAKQNKPKHKIVSPAEDKGLTSSKPKDMFRIDGNHMNPQLPDGAIVSAKEIPRWFWPCLCNGIFAVEFEGSIIIRRIKESSINCILSLYCDNAKLSEVLSIPMNDITRVWSIESILDAPVS